MNNLLSPKAYFQLLYQVFFKINYFKRKASEWSFSRKIKVIIISIFYNFIISVIVIYFITCFTLGWTNQYTFKIILSDYWFLTIICSLLISSISLGLLEDINAATATSIGLGIPLCIIIGIIYIKENYTEDFSTVFNVYNLFVLGLYTGITNSIIFKIERHPVTGIALGIFFSFIYGLNDNFTKGFDLSIGLILGYYLGISRFFYYPNLFFQKVYNQFYPLNWDENIAFPIWFLPTKIRSDAKKELQKTVDFTVMLIQERPIHRKTAQKGLLYITADVIAGFQEITTIAKSQEKLNFLPQGRIPDDFNNALAQLLEQSRNLKQALNNYQKANQIREIKKVQGNLEEFQKEMNFTRGAFAREFGKVARVWLEVIENYLKEKEGNLPLPNPFITGNSLKAEAETFVGRKDILNEIKTETLKEGAAGAILFVGNRRTGKTSTLYNLPKILPNYIQAYYFDAQDARMRVEKHFSRQFAKSFGSQDLDQSQDFATLTDFLEEKDKELKANNEIALICLDEYERLADLPHFPDSLRYWIQHLENIIFLLAGSYELDENKADETNANIQRVDWTDYLINARTVKISYLDKEAALQLVTQSVPDYDLTYANKGLPEFLVEQTGCQPYLLQLTMYELTEYLNAKESKTAQEEDIKISLQKMLNGAEQYLKHIWEETLNEASQKILIHLAESGQLPEAERKYIKRLLHKEFIREQEGGGYEFCVPIFQEWILDNFSNQRN